MKYLKGIFAILLVSSIGALGYYGHRLWVFSGKVSKHLEYVGAAIDCLIMQDGQSRTDIDILFQGFRSRESYYKAVNKIYPNLYSKEEIKKYSNYEAYNTQIPECKVFFTEYRCWSLDPHSNKSLDGCGKHFRISQEDIDAMKSLNDKNDYKGVVKIMDDIWNKRKRK